MVQLAHWCENYVILRCPTLAADEVASSAAQSFGCLFFVVLVLVFVLVLVLVLALLLFLVSFCFCLLIGQSTNTEASWLLHKCCYETTVAF